NPCRHQPIITTGCPSGPAQTILSPGAKKRTCLEHDYHPRSRSTLMVCPSARSVRQPRFTPYKASFRDSRRLDGDSISFLGDAVYGPLGINWIGNIPGHEADQSCFF